MGVTGYPSLVLARVHAVHFGRWRDGIRARVVGDCVPHLKIKYISIFCLKSEPSGYSDEGSWPLVFDATRYLRFSQ